jgi:hypothetical protein
MRLSVVPSLTLYVNESVPDIEGPARYVRNGAAPVRLPLLGCLTTTYVKRSPSASLPLRVMATAALGRVLVERFSARGGLLAAADGRVAVRDAVRVAVGVWLRAVVDVGVVADVCVAVTARTVAAVVDVRVAVTIRTVVLVAVAVGVGVPVGAPVPTLQPAISAAAASERRKPHRTSRTGLTARIVMAGLLVNHCCAYVYMV